MMTMDRTRMSAASSGGGGDIEHHYPQQGDHSSRQRPHPLEPPSTTTQVSANHSSSPNENDNFFSSSPLSYSPSVASSYSAAMTMTMTTPQSSYYPRSNHSNHVLSHPPPPPPSIQKSVLVQGMANIISIENENENQYENGKDEDENEMSRLLSLSSAGGTPRSILSNRSSTTERMQHDLQEVLEYIDGMTFVTPFKHSGGGNGGIGARNGGTPGSRMLGTASFVSPLPTSHKPPRGPSSTGNRKAVLADRSNHAPTAVSPFPHHSAGTTIKKETTPAPPLPPSSWKHHSARDPTPSKPKPVGLDLLREMNENHHGLGFFQNEDAATATVPAAVDQSSLIVEVSHSTAAEDEDDQENDYRHHYYPGNSGDEFKDPPVDDSKIVEDSYEWTSPPRHRIPMEPEETKTPFSSNNNINETSILLGTAFADYDLRRVPGRQQNAMTTHTMATPFRRPAPLRTSWATPVQEDEASEVSQDGYTQEEEEEEEERYFATTNEEEHEGTSMGGPFGTLPLNFPPTPSLGLVDDAKLEELQSRLPESPRDAKEWLQTAVLALQEARGERDAARKWARDMKGAVTKWAEEQRKLIRCEASTRMDALEEREHQVRSQTHALTQLQVLVQELHQEFHATHSERQASESQIQQLILDQQARIHFLSQQLRSMEQTVTEGISQAARGTPTSQQSANSNNEGNHHAAFSQFVDPRPPAISTTHATNHATISRSSQKSTRSTTSTSSRIRKPLPNGGKGHLIVYSSGVEKEVHEDGTTVIRYTNGDVETNFGGGNKNGNSAPTTVAYFHAKEQILQITNTNDGSVLLEYPNGQIERHYANGVKAILFPDGTKAKISADGKVETYHRA